MSTESRVLDGRAWRPGEDVRALSRTLADARDRFLTTGAAASGVRPLVEQSWRRCLSDGLDPERAGAGHDLDAAALRELRRTHPLAAVRPIIKQLLLDDAVDAGLLVAIGDAEGRLLWVEGEPATLRKAERIDFVEGSCWSEGFAGTNAPGTALALDRPMQIFSHEHLSRPVTDWSCTAAPIHDPAGQVIGVLDLTGGDDVASPTTLGLVRATVAAVEGELRVRRLRAPAKPPASRGSRGSGARRTKVARLDLLGRPTGRLHRADGTSADLSLRHSEILFLLATHPRGLSGGELAVMLSESDLAPVTLRAEVSRLRQAIAPLSLDHRPYRLSSALGSDVGDVVAALDGDDPASALSRYEGQLLPPSSAPGITAVRDSVHERVRAIAMGADADPLAVLRFADAEHSRDDWELWSHLATALPAGPHRDRARRHLARLDADLGTTARSAADATLLQRPRS